MNTHEEYPADAHDLPEPIGYGCNCPRCGKDEIDGGWHFDSFDLEDGIIYQRVYCGCGFTWTDAYELDRQLTGTCAELYEYHWERNP